MPFSRAYYNEIDSYAAGWLRNLIAEGLIAPGDVDDRSIVDVQPDDLRGWTNRGKGRLVQDVVGEPKVRWEVCVDKPVPDLRRVYAGLVAALEEAARVRR